jgi:hypothetical protein
MRLRDFGRDRKRRGPAKRLRSVSIPRGPKPSQDSGRHKILCFIGRFGAGDRFRTDDLVLGKHSVLQSKPYGKKAFARSLILYVGAV